MTTSPRECVRACVYVCSRARARACVCRFGGLGVVGGQVGQRVLRRLVERTGRPSIVIFLLGGVIALAVLCMTAIGVASVVAKVVANQRVGDFHMETLQCGATG